MSRVLSSLETDALYHSFVDEDAAGDIAFFLYATIAYCIVRLATELTLPGKIRGYTYQQYVVTLGHQAVLLPCLGVGWWVGFFQREGSSLIYLLTGAYMVSDSIVNYSPVSGCVAAFRDAEKPTFSYAVHIHHFFTFALCALGTTLPSWLEDEGAVCILLGEAGSLWITVTLIWPTALNYILRFYTFMASRVLGVLVAVDIMRQLKDPLPRLLLLAMGFGIAHDNWKSEWLAPQPSAITAPTCHFPNVYLLTTDPCAARLSLSLCSSSPRQDAHQCQGRKGGRAARQPDDLVAALRSHF